MKIYLHADMEGASGINRIEQVKKEFPDAYAEGCRLLARELNVFIDAAFRHGASGVTVCDTHGGGGNLAADQLDPRAALDLPAFPQLLAALDDSFDAVFLVGHHAMAGTPSAFLDHSFSSASIFALEMDGRAVGEIGIEALYAAARGAPVALVSGDAATAEETRRELPDAETVVLKRAQIRNRCSCLPLEEADRRIDEGVRRALAALPPKPDPAAIAWPRRMQTTFFRTDMADEFRQKHTRAERLDGCRVAWQANSHFELLHP